MLCQDVRVINCCLA